MSARIEFTDVVDARGWWQFEVQRVKVVAGSEAQPTTRTQYLSPSNEAWQSCMHAAGCCE